MSPTGIAALLGLTAALCFGTGDFAAQRLTTHSGWLRALLAVQLVALPLVTGVALAIDGAPVLRGDLPALLLGLGLLNILGLVALYRSFAAGALSVVAPIASSFAAVTVALAALDGRAPPGPTLLGLALIILGVVAVTAAHDGPAGAPRPRGAGVAWACLSSMSLGAVFFGLEGAAAELGPLWPVVALRLLGVLVLLALAALSRPRGAAASQGPRPPAGRLAPPLVLASALLDTAGMVVYSAGARLGDVAVVAVLASLFSVVTLALAQLRLRERLARGQWLGVACVLAGTAWVTWRANAA